MRWILIAVVVLGALVSIVAGVGALLPKGHVASRTARLRQPAEAVWSAITDYAGAPSWRTELARVERLPDRNGHEVWSEVSKRGEVMPLETLESVPPRRLVRKIADPKLPFGGAWTIEITPSDSGSDLRITENGEVYNPIFRFISRFVIGHTATIDGYLKALGKRFGEEIVPSN